MIAPTRWSPTRNTRWTRLSSSSSSAPLSAPWLMTARISSSVRCGSIWPLIPKTRSTRLVEPVSNATSGDADARQAHHRNRHPRRDGLRVVQADALGHQLADDERQVGDRPRPPGRGRVPRRRAPPAGPARAGPAGTWRWSRRRRLRPARRRARSRSAPWRGTWLGALASASAALAMRSPSSARCWRRTLRAATMAISDIAKTPLASSSTSTTTISVPTPPIPVDCIQSRRARAGAAGAGTRTPRGFVPFAPVRRGHLPSTRPAGDRPPGILAAMVRGLAALLLAPAGAARRSAARPPAD